MFHVLNWTSAFQRRQYSTEGNSILPRPASPLQNLHFPFLWLCFSIRNSSFNPNKVAYLLCCDLFLNIKSLTPSHLNVIMHSYNVLSTFLKKINASRCRQHVHICLLHEIPTGSLAHNCQSWNCIANILGKLDYQVSNIFSVYAAPEHMSLSGQILSNMT